VNLQGYCYAPDVSFQQERIFFPPCYVGVSSTQSFSVKNNSRIPLEYEWRVPEKYKYEVKFHPNKAFLQPNEDMPVMATFTPLKKKEYGVSVPFYVRNLFDQVKNSIGYFNPGSGTSVAAYNSRSSSQLGISTLRKDIQIIGAGSDGAIKISPDNLDFGTITVGFQKNLAVYIQNSSNCNLYIELKMVQSSQSDNKHGMTQG